MVFLLGFPFLLLSLFPFPLSVFAFLCSNSFLVRAAGLALPCGCQRCLQTPPPLLGGKQVFGNFFPPFSEALGGDFFHFPPPLSGEILVFPPPFWGVFAYFSGFWSYFPKRCQCRLPTICQCKPLDKSLLMFEWILDFLGCFEALHRNLTKPKGRIDSIGPIDL